MKYIESPLEATKQMHQQQTERERGLAFGPGVLDLKPPASKQARERERERDRDRQERLGVRFRA